MSSSRSAFRSALAPFVATTLVISLGIALAACSPSSAVSEVSSDAKELGSTQTSEVSLDRPTPLTEAPSPTAAPDTVDVVVQAFVERAAAATSSWNYLPKDLVELMPNTLLKMAGSDEDTKPLPQVDAVVRGRFTSSQVWSSHVWTDSDDEDAIEVSESARADTRVILLRFEQSEIISASATLMSEARAAKRKTVPDSIFVSVVIPGDVDAQQFGSGMIGLGDTILFLQSAAGDPDIPSWGIAYQAEALGQVINDGHGDESQRVIFPIRDALSAAGEVGLLSQLDAETTVAQLRQWAAEPWRTVTAY